LLCCPARPSNRLVGSPCADRPPRPHDDVARFSLLDRCAASGPPDRLPRASLFRHASSADDAATCASRPHLE